MLRYFLINLTRFKSLIVIKRVEQLQLMKNFKALFFYIRLVLVFICVLSGLSRRALRRSEPFIGFPLNSGPSANIEFTFDYNVNRQVAPKP
jgi:hypothetical protein